MTAITAAEDVFWDERDYRLLIFLGKLRSMNAY
jgi:hypothetical protein